VCVCERERETKKEKVGERKRENFGCLGVVVMTAWSIVIVCKVYVCICVRV
jgi:hypothetical protein